MMLEYTHPELDKEVYGIAGYYKAQEEGRLPYNGREVLYIFGQVAIETSCCGVGAWNYVQVPGFIVNWHMRDEGTETPVSELEPIGSHEDREGITKIMQERYPWAHIEIG